MRDFLFRADDEESTPLMQSCHEAVPCSLLLPSSVPTESSLPLQSTIITRSVIRAFVGWLCSGLARKEKRKNDLTWYCSLLRSIGLS
eukprot:scaffold3600_cov171-Amphora_coffeaeformis.AAC.8